MAHAGDQPICGSGVIVAPHRRVLPLKNPPPTWSASARWRVFYILVCGSLVLDPRCNSPDLHRPVRAPGILVRPILGIRSCLVPMLALPIETWIRLLVCMGLGLVVYFLYGVNHAKR